MLRSFVALSSLIIILSLPISITAQVRVIEKDPVDWVNPLMGTSSRPELSHGNTYPAIGLPWGMNYWSPQTNKMGHGWMYQYEAEKIRGFKQTHQPSPWMNDYGQFSIMPVTGSLKFDQDSRASWFSHKSETATPYYYSAYLADWNVTAELAPTERAAVFRFTFPRSDSSFIIVDAFDRGSYIKIIPSENKIIGYSTRYARGKLVNFRNYFLITCDKPFEVARAWHDSVLTRDTLELSAAHAGAVIGFRTAAGEPVHLRVASSLISFEQAELNLKRELGNKDFDEVKKEARQAWNDLLGRVKVEGGTVDQMRTFYSCLYRCLLFPQRLYEKNEQNEIVHYSPYNGKIVPGYMYGGTGFWDTFRALYPLLNLLYPSVNLEMQEALSNAFTEGGFLPEWSSPGYADIMIGNNSASVVTEAYLKGVRVRDIENLYKALQHGANNEGPVSAVGRKGVYHYNQLGYVPYDVGINESAARTLEYAYDDFAIYQLAKALKKPQQELDLLARRAQNYRNLFDPETGLMRGKKQDGTFQSPFNPFKWGDAFTEGNSWHYTWSVFHDVQGLINLMGGDERFTAKLDSVFSLPPVYDESYYGGVIHEIREMQIINMGQYAHGNQPIQHLIYLYNYGLQPWKTQFWAREVMERLYKPAPDGYCGDEDNGQTSAWYVFSALGFYPVCPASDELVIGSPLFRKATIILENNNRIVINAPDNSSRNIYVQKIRLNGKEWPHSWFSHAGLMLGATIDFSLSSEAARSRATSKKNVPFSVSSPTN